VVCEFSGKNYAQKLRNLIQWFVASCAITFLELLFFVPLITVFEAPIFPLVFLIEFTSAMHPQWLNMHGAGLDCTLSTKFSFSFLSLLPLPLSPSFWLLSFSQALCMLSALSPSLLLLVLLLVLDCPSSFPGGDLRWPLLVGPLLYSSFF